MANTFRSKKKRGKNSKTSKKSKSKKLTLNDNQIRFWFGTILLFLSLFLFISFISYFFSGADDQSIVNMSLKEIRGQKSISIGNVLGILGAKISHLFLFVLFGLSSFLLIPPIFLLGFRYVFDEDLFKINLGRTFMASLFYTFIISLISGYFVYLFKPSTTSLSGRVGYYANEVLNNYLGLGSILFLLVILISWLIFFNGFKSVDDFLVQSPFKSKKKTTSIFQKDEPEEALEEPEKTPEKEEKPVSTPLVVEEVKKPEPKVDTGNGPFKGPDIAFTIEETKPEEIAEPEETANELVKEFGEYDPRLDLSSYQFPTIDLLKEYANEGAQVTQEELEENKNKIVETVNNFGIGISSIKATIGPTVTLYEIVPEPGVRISKIKNLEDDIALSLAALGIRIIAPMPGKGTIGIEVPNKKREMVSIRSVMGAEKFRKSKYALPVILGKTIANEIFVADLAKMPHLLMAGATGQGKSVGLNVILASLLYKKHPSEVKFVLVDPKKVELTLYNKIERHFLAMLPDSEEAIITDTKRVVNTLNSLTIEMDQRYDLLKDAGVRNIKEYNDKFVNRMLNPEQGHRYLPYIVLVVDELADLMMTAGKEVEQPIARLAQLARAIGIHLILATQRPSVNVITGLIKANFPARLSFKVTARVDSRTIMDTGGAEQLIGNGDLLLSTGSDIVRLQCPFIDTPEVDKLCDYIGSQRGYSSAYLLPEYYGDDEVPEVGGFDPNDLDPLFQEAAKLLVTHQQGSVSLIQRRMRLGYNRAGRIMDQLEGAGIVGPFEGSKAREVLIKDFNHLDEVLKAI